MGRLKVNVGFSVVVGLLVIGAISIAGAGEWALAQKPGATAPSTRETGNVDEPAGAVDQLDKNFGDYLHFAKMANFEAADAIAQELLKHPDLNPLSEAGANRLVELADKYETSIETLMLIIENTDIGENAKKILGLIDEAYKLKWKNPERIKKNIELLHGTPMQQAVGLERLIESGEYAVPWMLRAIADPQQKDWQPFVVRAFPKLGRKALNPLIEALAVENEAVRNFVAQVLGKIGYPQALPYLQRLATDEGQSASIRESAADALEQIVLSDPKLKKESAVELFNDLAEQYYANLDSLRPDPREDRINVWFYRQVDLIPVEVPRGIYNLVMCMRCCESSLKLDSDQSATAALWLAANFRREAALGLDVQSAESAEVDDLTRPANFPRSIYFAGIMGPLRCQIALSRAIKDRDRDVALGAIAGLNLTAGPATMVNPEAPLGMSLAEALYFPDLLVRIQAALALGRALPKDAFKGADEVVPVLASALSVTGKKYYLLVEPEAASREKVEASLLKDNTTVVSADRFEPALTRAHEQLTHLDGIFLASDMKLPTVIEAIRTLAKDERFALAPIVVFIKPGDALIADRVANEDKRIGRVLVSSDDDQTYGKLADLLLAKRDVVADKFGYKEIPPELGILLAGDAARTLEVILATGSKVFDVLPAQRALIDDLSHPSADLQAAAVRTLARLDTELAQRAIASMALNRQVSEPLRKTAFSALADSARRFGTRLDEQAIQALIQLVLDEEIDLDLRTEASRALGAMNLPGRYASEIILAKPMN